MNNHFGIIGFVVAIIALGSSAATLMQAKKGGASNASNREATVVDSNADLKLKVEALEAKVQQQRKDYDAFRQTFNQLWESGVFSGKNRSVTLDLASRGYGKVDTDNGFLLVSCQEVQEYLDGYKVRLHIGNPLVARYVGFKVTAKWGPRFAGARGDTDAFLSWYHSLRSREYSFPHSLEPGRWNAVEIILPQTAASQLGDFQVSVETNTVSLQMPGR